MTTDNATTTTDTTTTHSALPDPRPDLGAVAAVARTIIAGVDQTQLGDPTPCTEFTVHDLLDHLDQVFRRVAALGNGQSWDSVQEHRVSTSVGDYAAAADVESEAMMDAWADSAKLDRVLELPWTTLTAPQTLFTYAGEIAIHAWDLATATGQSISIDDGSLAGALVAWQQVPAEGRATPELPFDEVVDPGADAPVLLQLAGWTGRQVV